MAGTINGWSIAYCAAGGIILWSGIAGASISDAFKDIIGGQPVTADGTEGIGSAPTADTLNTNADTPQPVPSETQAQLEQLWVKNGGDQDTAAFAAAVAYSESGGSATVTSPNPDGGTNVGLFQLDTKGVGAGYTVEQLQDPDTNTKITILATQNGTNWTEWGDPITYAVGYHYTPGEAVPS